MENEKELKDLLILLNQQSLRISELEKEKSTLISNLQETESQLSETIVMAEKMKGSLNQLKYLQEENAQLKESLNLSETLMEARISDLKKEYEIRHNRRSTGTGSVKINERDDKSFLNQRCIGLLGSILLAETIIIVWWCLI